MAFRGETSAVRVSDIQVGLSDTGSVSMDHKAVAPADRFRVRLALGFMIAVAMIDCVLYLPRLF